MTDFQQGLLVYGCVDLVATVLVVNAARHDPMIRASLVRAFKLIMGDARLSVNVIESPEFTDCGDDFEEEHEERCEGSEDGGCCTDNDLLDENNNQVDGLRPEDQGEDDEKDPTRN